MNTTTVSSVTDKFLNGSEAIVSTAPHYLRSIQEEALSFFSSKGFPTTRNEEWKYTNLQTVTGRPVQLNAGKALTTADIDAISYLEKDSIVIVMENGVYNSALSRIPSLPSGLLIGNLADHLDHPVVQKHLGKYADFRSEELVALNTVFIRNGIFIHAGKNTKCEKPIFIIHINKGGETLSYPRQLTVAEKGSDLKIVESANGNVASFVNAVTEIFVDDNAIVEIAKIQQEGNEAVRIDHTEASLNKESLFHIHTITTGGKLVRNDLHIVLNDEHANAYLNGLYLADRKMHVDNHTLVDHAKPNCHSNELYKGILNGSSHGVFNGKIMVRRDAQKTNAYQSSKSIILSDDATMNAKPQLEIYADDVKCSHGATTGRLDEESLFYLRSRGIGIKEAQALLTLAFAEDVLSRINIEEIKDHLVELIHQSLGEAK